MRSQTKRGFGTYWVISPSVQSNFIILLIVKSKVDIALHYFPYNGYSEIVMTAAFFVWITFRTSNHLNWANWVTINTRQSKAPVFCNLMQTISSFLSQLNQA